MSTSPGRIASLPGVDMYYELHGQGEPVLLLHGFTGVGADWAHAGRDELARQFRLIVPDLRGHGRTTGPAGGLTHRQCAIDVLALLDHLGVRRCKALGLSMGGNTLLHMGTRSPDRIEAMVLISATPYYPEEARAIMRQVSVEDHSDEEWRSMRARHPQGDEQIRALFAQQRAFASDYDDLSFTPAHLAAITARTLIIYGDRDPLHPVGMAVEMYQAIPRASLWVVPSAGHGPIFGEASGPFLRAVLEFLAG